MKNEKYINKQCENFISNFKNDLVKNKYDKIFVTLQWTSKTKFTLNDLIDYLNFFEFKIYLVGNAKFQNVPKIAYNMAVRKNLNKENLANKFFRNLDKKKYLF